MKMNYDTASSSYIIIFHFDIIYDVLLYIKYHDVIFFIYVRQNSETAWCIILKWNIIIYIKFYDDDAVSNFIFIILN